MSNLYARVLCHLPYLFCSGNAHVIKAFNDNFVSSTRICREFFVKLFSKGVTTNNQWTLALSIFYVGYCEAHSNFVIFISHNLLRAGLLEMPANGECTNIEIVHLSYARHWFLVLQRHIGANRLYLLHFLHPYPSEFLS